MPGEQTSRNTKDDLQYRHNPYIAVILAGGKNERFVEGKIPKVLQFVDGETLLERQIRQLEESGLNKQDIVVITNPYSLSGHEILAYVQKHFPDIYVLPSYDDEGKARDLQSICEENMSLLSPKTGVWEKTSNLFKDKKYLFVTLGDSLYGQESIENALKKSSEKLPDYSAIIFTLNSLSRKKGRKIEADEQGKVRAISEKNKEDLREHSALFSFDISAIRTLDKITDGGLSRLTQKLSEKNHRVLVKRSKEIYADINDLQAYLEARIAARYTFFGPKIPTNYCFPIEPYQHGRISRIIVDSQGRLRPAPKTGEDIDLLKTTWGAGPGIAPIENDKHIEKPKDRVIIGKPQAGKSTTNIALSKILTDYTLNALQYTTQIPPLNLFSAVSDLVLNLYFDKKRKKDMTNKIRLKIISEME